MNIISNELEYNIISKIIPSLVIDENNCWLRSRKASKEVYQYISLGKKRVQAHVLSASLFLEYNKESNLFVCHKCDIKACFNPEHLFIGTTMDNNLDYYRKKNIKTVLEKLELTYHDIVQSRELEPYRDFTVEEFIEMMKEDNLN